MTNFKEDGENPPIRILADIAEPFVIDYLHDKYSRMDAFQLYAREASRRGYGHCSNIQLENGFSFSYLSKRLEMADFKEAGKDPITRILADIAKPYVIGFMHDKYSEQDAFQLYVQEASRQGYSHCSNIQLENGFSFSSVEITEKDPTIRALSSIADPFTIGFMYDKKYSEQDAFQLYVQEASRRGYSHCSNNQFRIAFSRARNANR